MKDPDATITLTATYELTNEALKKLQSIECITRQIQYIDVKLNAREALRTGYISDDPEDKNYILCEPKLVLGELKPNLDKLGVLREILPRFDHFLNSDEATTIVMREMQRYDKVLALSKAENEKKQKPKIPDDSLRVTLVGTYLLTLEALRAAQVLWPETRQKQTVLISVDEKKARQMGYVNERHEYDDFILCKIEPDLEKDVRVLRGPKLPSFDHILSEEEAAKFVTDEMSRYDEIMAISKTMYEARERKKHSLVELSGTYWLTEEALRAMNQYGSAVRIITFKVDAEKALLTGYATRSSILNGQPLGGDNDFTFSRLEPDLDKEGVVRRWAKNQFDHILTNSEAADIVTKEMERYDEVLGISRKVQELRARSQSTTVVLVGAYLLTKDAYENLALSGTGTSRQQHVPVVLDAKEAVRTKCATIYNGNVVPLVSEHVLFQKNIPDPNYEEISKSAGFKEFDHILTVEEASEIVTNEMARFDEVLATFKKKREAHTKEKEEIEAKKRAEKQILDERWQKEQQALEEMREKARNDFLEELSHYMLKMADGEHCVIDSNKHERPMWLEMDGKRIDVRYDLLDSKECDAVKKTLLGEWRKRTDAEIAAWIKEHGSPRLKKAVEADILCQIRGAYRSERLAIELPGWEFLSEEEEKHIKDRLNPSENEIDALTLARKKWPKGNARLSSIRVIFKPPAFEGWAPFLVMKCPFHDSLVSLHLNENATTPTVTIETSSKSENADDSMNGHVDGNSVNDHVDGVS